MRNTNNESGIALGAVLDPLVRTTSGSDAYAGCRELQGLYSKQSLAIPAETTGRFLSLFTKPNLAIIFGNSLISQVVIKNSMFLATRIKRKLPNLIRLIW